LTRKQCLHTTYCPTTSPGKQHPPHASEYHNRRPNILSSPTARTALEYVIPYQGGIAVRYHCRSERPTPQTCSSYGHAYHEWWTMPAPRDPTQVAQAWLGVVPTWAVSIICTQCTTYGLDCLQVDCTLYKGFQTTSQLRSGYDVDLRGGRHGPSPEHRSTDCSPSCSQLQLSSANYLLANNASQRTQATPQ
jgi:hypothetical protein